MKRNSFSKKRIIHTFVIIFILVMIILISILLMLKYNIEGEKKLPFNISKVNIVSTAESTDSKLTKEGDAWNTKILQKNDIFFVIEKNSNYKKEDAIRRISFENFNINKKNESMDVKIYRPTVSSSTYNYSDEYKIENSLEYLGGQSTNTETLQINNQGGVIGFSIATGNNKEYSFPKNEKLNIDGRLLSKAGMEIEDIMLNISFDIVIETESENRFKTSMNIDLPTGNILKEGVCTLEDTDLNNIVFKRF